MEVKSQGLWQGGGEESGWVKVEVMSQGLSQGVDEESGPVLRCR